MEADCKVPEWNKRAVEISGYSKNETVGMHFDEEFVTAGDLSQLTGTANAPIFGVEADCEVAKWNRKAFEISGHAKKEPVDWRFDEVFVAVGDLSQLSETANVPIFNVEVDGKFTE